MAEDEEESTNAEPTEEEQAAERDRDGGRQFGRVMMVLGLAGAVAGAFFAEDQYLVGGGLALIAIGAVAYRWPVEIVRLLSGMSDKM